MNNKGCEPVHPAYPIQNVKYCYLKFVLFLQDPNDSILEADEASQIEAAIKASLAESDNKKASPAACEGDEESHAESDALETFDSDHEEVDYSLDKKNPKRTLNGENSLFRKVVSASDEKDDSKSSHTEEKSSDSETTPFSDDLDWKSYLGPADDPESKLMLRLPDGTRDIVSMPSSSKLMVCCLSHCLLYSCKRKKFLKFKYGRSVLT